MKHGIPQFKRIVRKLILFSSTITGIADLLNNTGLLPNDCQQVDLLADGTINDWDLLVLIDLVMAGGN